MTRPVTREAHPSGSQPQRTALAWSRTALAAAALAGAALKAAVDRTSVASIVCAVVTALAAAAIFGCGQLRGSAEKDPGAPTPRLFQVATLSAVIAAVAAFVLAVG